MIILPGKKIAEEILDQVKNQVENLSVPPKLAVINIGADPNSEIYINMKRKAAAAVGIDFQVFQYDRLPVLKLQELIRQLNQDATVSGIIVQLPVPTPRHLLAFLDINSSKDVDGLSPLSLGLLFQNRNIIPGATPKAIITAINYISKQSDPELSDYLKGKNILIINSSILIGKPLAAYLLNAGATVTVAHIDTENLSNHFPGKDIIITATGKEIITTNNANFLKDGVILIDSGFRKERTGFTGDINANAVAHKASWLTPVPRGIGPIGVACLLENTLLAYRLQATQTHS